MSTLTHSVTTIVLALTIVSPSLPMYVEAYTLTAPSSSVYWVAGETNTLKWNADAGDPEVFDVHLLDEDQRSLNGNFQVGNTLKTEAGTAELQIINIPSGQYRMLFTNSSNYEKDKAQVYFTSDVFTVKPHGTPLASAPATSSDGGSASQQDGSSSPGATTGATSSNSTSTDAPTTASQNSTSSAPKESGGDATKSTASASVANHASATATSGTATNGTLSSGDSINAADGVHTKAYVATALTALLLLGGCLALIG